MEEKEIYEALGLELPQRQDEAPEGAGDGQESAQELQNGQEGQEPESGQDELEDGQEGIQEGQEPEEQEKPKEQKAQTLTREALEEAVRQAVARERQRQEQVMADFFRSANLRDPVTGEIIRDMSGLESYSQAAETRRLERNLAEGKLTPEDIPVILDSGNRTLAGPTAPPGGLYLTRVWYEDERLNG